MIHGIWTHYVKSPLKTTVKITARIMKPPEVVRTENLGLPPEMIEKHDPWPAYVSYMSPVVRKLVEISEYRKLECFLGLEKSQETVKENQSSSVVQLKRRKPSKVPGEIPLEDRSSEEIVLSVWGKAPDLAFMSHSRYFHTNTKQGPTAKYSEVIFCQKPSIKNLPYRLPPAEKKKH